MQILPTLNVKCQFLNEMTGEGTTRRKLRDQADSAKASCLQIMVDQQIRAEEIKAAQRNQRTTGYNVTREIEMSFKKRTGEAAVRRDRQGCPGKGCGHRNSYQDLLLLTHSTERELIISPAITLD